MPVMCPMTRIQKSVYQRVLKLPDFQLLVRRGEPCSCGRSQKRGECCHRAAHPNPERPEEGGILWPKFHPDGVPCEQCPTCMSLPCMQKLLNITNHLELVKVPPHATGREAEIDRDFARAAFGSELGEIGGVAQAQRYSDKCSTLLCGKMKVLQDLLKEASRKRDKVLLFSASTRTLKILEIFIQSMGYGALYLDGSTPQKTRQALCDEFNTSAAKFVFLMSTKAGGVGLNLTAANIVIIFDPTWNPAHDLQAEDRCVVSTTVVITSFVRSLFSLNV